MKKLTKVVAAVIGDRLVIEIPLNQAIEIREELISQPGLAIKPKTPLEHLAIQVMKVVDDFESKFHG